MKYTPEEIKQHRAEWVAALRSGKYKQARNALRVADSYCCLGVACEVAGMEYEPTSPDLPKEVSEWLGITTSSPRSTGPAVGGEARPSYTNLNDVEDYTFERIADHFEQYGFDPMHDALAQEGAES